MVGAQVQNVVSYLKNNDRKLLSCDVHQCTSFSTILQTVNCFKEGAKPQVQKDSTDMAAHVCMHAHTNSEVT